MNPTVAPTTEPSAVLRGIFWMILTGLLFTALDAVAKYVSQTYPVAQIVWARFALQAVLLPVLLGHRLPQTLKTERFGLQMLRSFLVLAATGVLFLALRYIPLADANAISFVNPLIVTALSVPLLKEHVEPRLWFGVAAGFLGALIIIRPGLGLMHPAAFLALGSATLFALYHLTTRMLSKTDAPMTTLLYTAILPGIATTALMPFVWMPPDAKGWALFAFMGVANALSAYTLIKAFSAAPAAVVTPFGYFNLLWATILGFILFGQLPDAWTVSGAALIVGSGLYILKRKAAGAGKG